MRKIILAALLFFVACGCERPIESRNSGNSQVRNSLDTRYPILKHLKKRFDGLSQSELVAIEKQLDVVLPADFKEFLSSINGGVFYEDYLLDPRPRSEYSDNGRKSRCGVEFFLRFGDETSLYSADKCIRNLGDRFPSEMIPIACTNDTCIVISCRQKDYGAIHYVDRTNEIDNDPERNLRIIGNSFEVFLRDLRMSE